MKLLRLRVVALILVLFIIIMSSCAGERGILPVQVDGIGTDRQGEKIEDHLEDQQVHSNTGEVELIPREVLFADPVRTSPSISPDGTKLAYRLFEDGYDTILVKYLDQDRDDIPVQQPGTPGNYRFFWAGDNKHILILQDYLGDENYHLYASNIETGRIKDLTPYKDVQAILIGTSIKRPDEVLIALNRDNPANHDVYRVKISSGSLELLERNPGNIQGWMIDDKGDVRGALTSNTDGGSDLLVRDNKDSEWRTLISWDYESSNNSAPLGFTKDGRSMLILDSRESNTGRLIRVDIRTGETTTLVEDPQYDVYEVLVDDETYEVQAASFIKDRKEWVFFNADTEKAFETISKLNDGDVSFISGSEDDRIWLLAFTSDDEPLSYYIYNREEDVGTHLFDELPELNNYTLAKTEPISFKSRDGLTIHGYITFPPGSKRQDLPMILNVHGGPWSRDTWGFDPEVQWMANRGYVVLQINFRGSSGYGKDFLNAGNKEWGGKMHDDLIDGVNWAIEKGYADPDRIGIYGGSYGGYAALVGASFTPDVFACAVDLFGPSNLVTLLESIPPYWTPILDNYYKRVGNLETEKEFLESRSPLFKVDQIKIPVLIAQGGNDPRVKQSESDQIVKAMEEHNLDVRYLLFPNAGHSFSSPDDRITFYTAAEKFLAEHLGGRWQE
ncbi:MAG: S9 family peptidase [Caldicoprobacterales bacterium]|jgi:dipeptidyl aminopeptidase/acylaminoacyl peptidase